MNSHTLRISQIWKGLQGVLFPFLEENLGTLTKKQKQLISILEVISVETFFEPETLKVGCPKKNRIALFCSLIAKMVLNIPTTKDLVDRLNCDNRLQKICGYNQSSDIPSESTFSRAFQEFSILKTPEKIHKELIKISQSERLIGHISRDGSEIEAREKPVRRKKLSKKQKKIFKRGRPKKDEIRPPKEPSKLEKQKDMTLEEMIKSIPKNCSIGSKKNSKGHQHSWIGYKLHLDVADGQIPISCMLTSASVHDSRVLPVSLCKSS